MDNNGGEDRISSLTDVLLLQILSFLNTRDAIQTCVLSKRWISVWKSLPYLYFDYDCFPSGYIENKKAWFTSFINHVLARRYPTNLVEVCFCSYGLEMDPLIVESVICYAVQHNVQILDVRSSFQSDYSIRWPQSFYNCQSIPTLEIENHYLSHFNNDSIQLPKYLGLQALKSLYLFNFIITEEDFDPRIFSSCPNLETLKLYILVFNLTVLKIHALNLRNLTLSLAPEIEWSSGDRCKFEILAPKLTTFTYKDDCCANIVHFMANLSSLDDVYYEIFSLDPIELKEEDCCYLINTFKEFRHAKSLTVSLHILEVLSTYPALLDEDKLWITGLKNLKIRIGEPYDGNGDVVIPSSVLNRFLSGSTSLEICW